MTQQGYSEVEFRIGPLSGFICVRWGKTDEHPFENIGQEIDMIFEQGRKELTRFFAKYKSWDEVTAANPAPLDDYDEEETAEEEEGK